MGGKTDWVGKKLTSQIFPRGKKLTGEKTDRYTGTKHPMPFFDTPDKTSRIDLPSHAVFVTPDKTPHDISATPDKTSHTLFKAYERA